MVPEQQVPATYSAASCSKNRFHFRVGAFLDAVLLENGIEHFRDESLLASGELGEFLELALQLGSRSAFGGFGLEPDQFLDGESQGLREYGQVDDGNSSSSFLERDDALLRAVGKLGELDLGQSTFFAQCCDLLAELYEKGLFFGIHPGRGSVLWHELILGFPNRS